jgi:hypothetical protein
MPYLDTETEAYITRYIDMETGIETKPACPYSQFKRMRDLEKAYCSSGSIHVPRSLDQSYYVGLDSLEASIDQDMDQVVYRYMTAQRFLRDAARTELTTADKVIKNSTLPGLTNSTAGLAKRQSTKVPKTEQNSKHAKILMVNQLWL